MDAPPLLPVTDAAVLTAISDGAFVVISTGKTLDTELGAALGQLEAVRGKVLGVIFNRVPKRDSTSGYYGGSYQSTVRDQAPTTIRTTDAPVVTPESRAPRSPARR